MSPNVTKNMFKFTFKIKDPLFKNSFYIMLTSISTAGFGFLFWMLAARLYTAEEVGIATALISSMTLIVLLSKVGMDSSIIRFIPKGDKNSVFNTSIIVTTFSSLCLGIIFIMGVKIFSPELQFLKSPENAILYIMYIVANSLATTAGITFLSLRKAECQFIQSIVSASRILFLILLIPIGKMGIFSAVGLSFILSFIFASIFFEKIGIKLKFVVDKEFLKNSFHYSADNYLISLFLSAPNQIIPLIALNKLGEEATAYYYITFAIASLLFMIPNSLSTSLFIEGSHGENLRKNAIKSLTASFAILIPSIILLYFGGDWLLGLVGKDYSDKGTKLLQIIIFTSIFISVTSTYSSIKRIQKDVKGIKLLSGIISVLLIILVYKLVPLFGIIGIGYSWVLSYGIGSILVGMMIWKERKMFITN